MTISSREIVSHTDLTIVEIGRLVGNRSFMIDCKAKMRTKKVMMLLVSFH